MLINTSSSFLIVQETMISRKSLRKPCRIFKLLIRLRKKKPFITEGLCKKEILFIWFQRFHRLRHFPFSFSDLQVHPGRQA